MLFDAVDVENDSTASEPKVAKEAIDFRDVKRIDHIIASLQRKVIIIQLKSYILPYTSCENFL